MKRYATVFAVVAMSVVAVSASWAQSGGMGGMGGMDMKDVNMSKCRDVMKGSDMSQCMDMMGKGKKGRASDKASQAKLHKGTGTVTKIDTAGGKVTIAHGPIQTMKWPAMSMTFGVTDKTLLERLASGKKIEFEFVQQGSDYVITTIK